MTIARVATPVQRATRGRRPHHLLGSCGGDEFCSHRLRGPVTSIFAGRCQNSCRRICLDCGEPHLDQMPLALARHPGRDTAPGRPSSDRLQVRDIPICPCLDVLKHFYVLKTSCVLRFTFWQLSPLLKSSFPSLRQGMPFRIISVESLDIPVTFQSSVPVHCFNESSPYLFSAVINPVPNESFIERHSSCKH